MRELFEYQKTIFKYAVAVALVIEMASLFFLGPDLAFGLGIAAGTLTSIVNSVYMAFTVYRAATTPGGSIHAALGYFGRLVLFGVVFVVAIRLSRLAALGVALGYFTVRIAIGIHTVLTHRRA